MRSEMMEQAGVQMDTHVPEGLGPVKRRKE